MSSHSSCGVICRPGGTRRDTADQTKGKKFMKASRLFIGMLSLLAISFSSGTAIGDEYASAISVFKSSPEVLPFFKNCYAYAIFPVRPLTQDYAGGQKGSDG
jgi:hypothetical protein